MNSISTGAMLLTLLSATVYGQVPTSNDTSDGNQNTGMGSGALNPATLTTGSGNTAAGYQALYNNQSGIYNTAVGTYALIDDNSGSYNVAIGALALYAVLGEDNVGVGFAALNANTSGAQNAALGSKTLQANRTGTQNVAVGYEALTNSGASSNTAVGWQALSADTTGGSNTALGSSALTFNQAGTSDVAIGYGALYRDTASNNTATGWQSLNANSSGAANTATGAAALSSSTTGSNNIALGYEAGLNVSTGSNNIEIGNEGFAADKNMLRIGKVGLQKKAFIAGIYNIPVTGNAVMVDAAGQLGVVVSSERFKTSIAPMGSEAGKLDKLRPVTFKLKTDAKGTVQYGLIAEEVAKIYPELVIRDANGRIDGVRYDELAPMLLNEVQQQAAKIESLERQVAKVNLLERRLDAMLQQLTADGLGAQR